jgi:hypothetical protein
MNKSLFCPFKKSFAKLVRQKRPMGAVLFTSYQNLDGRSRRLVRAFHTNSLPAMRRLSSSLFQKPAQCLHPEQREAQGSIASALPHHLNWYATKSFPARPLFRGRHLPHPASAELGGCLGKFADAARWLTPANSSCAAAAASSATPQAGGAFRAAPILPKCFTW